MKKKILHLMGVFLFLVGTQGLKAGDGSSADSAWTIGTGGADINIPPGGGNIFVPNGPGYYKLIDNIDVKVQSPMSGIHLDGQNYTITLASGANTEGVFQNITNSEVKNLTIKAQTTQEQGVLARTSSNSGFENIRIDATIIPIVNNPTDPNDATGGIPTGGLIGEANGCTFINCRTAPSVNVTSAGGNVGGLVGKATNGCTFNMCYAAGNVHQTGGTIVGTGLGNTAGDISIDHGNVGGLVGNLIGGTVNDCFSWGSVTSDIDWGDPGTFTTTQGVATTPPVSSCESVNAEGQLHGSDTLIIHYPSVVVTEANVGGLVGFSSGTISDSYTAGSISLPNIPASTPPLPLPPGSSLSPWLVELDSIASFGTTTGQIICDGPDGLPGTNDIGEQDTFYNGVNWVEKVASAPHFRTATFFGTLVGHSTIQTAFLDCYTVDVSAAPPTDFSGNIGFSPTGGRNLTNVSGKQMGNYSDLSFTSIWSMSEGRSYPLLTQTLVNDIGQKDYLQGSNYPDPYHSADGSLPNLIELCSKNNYGDGTDLATRPMGILNPTFRFTGSLTDYNSKFTPVLTTDSLLYECNYSVVSGGSTVIVPTSVTGNTGATYNGFNFPNYGVIPFAASVGKATTGVLSIRVTPINFGNTIYHEIAGDNAVGTGNDASAFGNSIHGERGPIRLNVAQINPRPTVAWKGIEDAIKVWTNPIDSLLIDHFYNTICFDYRDVDMMDTTNMASWQPQSSSNGPRDVFQNYDSAYFKVELTGTAPFSYYYDINDTKNGGTLGDNTSLVAASKIGVSTNTTAGSRILPSGSLTYINVISVLPYPVNATSPIVGGSEPRYTGYNLILDPSDDPNHSNKDSLNAGGALFPSSYATNDYRVTDGNGCRTETNIGGIIDPIHDDYSLASPIPDGPIQGYAYGYKPYFPATLPAAIPYDTVIKNPLPMVNFPYQDGLTYHGSDSDMVNTPRLHNDTVVCEGDTIRAITFSSPLIPLDSTFASSMRYFWRSIDNTDSHTTQADGWNTPHLSHPDRDTIPKVTRKPIQGGWDGNPEYPNSFFDVPGWAGLDRDTIWDRPFNTDLLLDISKAGGTDQLGIQDTIISKPFSGFVTNDDHLTIIDSGKVNGTYNKFDRNGARDTISRAWIRVTPYFVNVKKQACYAKVRNLGYKDYNPDQYRGVTDFGITVNPRPNFLEPEVQTVCFDSLAKPVQLRTHLRDDSLGRADTVWYSLLNFSPSMGLTMRYDSISKVDVPKQTDNLLFPLPGPEQNGHTAYAGWPNNGTIFDPSLPVGGAPILTDVIPGFTGVNGENVPLYDTIRVIPYFKNRDSRENICKGRADSVYYQLLPETKIVHDLIGDTLCNDTEHVLHTVAAGANLYYRWFYEKSKCDTIAPISLDEGMERQYYTAKATGWYHVVIEGDCGTAVTDTVHLILDSTPTFSVDLKEREQVCAGTSTSLSVSVENADSVYWYYDGLPIEGRSDGCGIYTLPVVNADPQMDYGYYQVKAVSYCGKTTMSTRARLWVVSPLSATLTCPDNFETGTPTELHVGNIPYGYNDVTWYTWSYTSVNGLTDNASFLPATEGVDVHSPTVSFRNQDSGTIQVDLRHACGDKNDSNGNYYTVSAIQADINYPTAIENVAADGLSVYPNPVENELKIESETAIEKIIVTDTNGRVIYNQNADGQTSVTVRVASWAKGSYIVTVETASKTAVRKVVKK